MEMNTNMTPTEYMAQNVFEWDGGLWKAQTIALEPKQMTRVLSTGRFGAMLLTTAGELALGGTFDVNAKTGRTTYTVVHDGARSRLYRREGDAFRRDFPGREVETS